MECREGVTRHEGLHAFGLQFRDVVGTIVLVRLDGEEKGVLRGLELAAIRQQVTYLERVLARHRSKRSDSLFYFR